MCFSATASLAASVLLITTSALTINKTRERSAIPLAMIPGFFGIQQGLEGLVWISQPQSVPYYIGMYGFLFCAYSLWPVYIPWTIALHERDPYHAGPRIATALVGTFVSGYFFLELLHGGIHATLSPYGICYSFWPPLWYGIGLYYIGVVVLAGLLSQERFLTIFSSGLALSFIIARLLSEKGYPSVWCFFAALLSFVIIYGLRQKNALHIPSQKKQKKPDTTQTQPTITRY